MEEKPERTREEAPTYKGRVSSIRFVATSQQRRCPAGREEARGGEAGEPRPRTRLFVFLLFTNAEETSFVSSFLYLLMKRGFLLACFSLINFRALFNFGPFYKGWR